MSERVDKAAFIRENGFYVSAPKGDSMRPFIRGRRDNAVILPPDRTPRWGDVILYEADGVHVLHRVLRHKDGVFVVRGDNCFYKERVADAQIIGILQSVLRGGKRKYSARGPILAAVFFWQLLYPVRYALHGLHVQLARLKKKLR